MYVKIFEQIFDSSVSEDYQTRLVFTDLLVLADEDGIVDMTAEAIARRTNVPLEIVRAGIQKLEQPDPQSRSKDEGGRRLVRLDDHRDWGWAIVNYGKYRDLRTKADRREYHRDYWRSKRTRKAGATQPDSTETQPDSTPLNRLNPSEADANSEANSNSEAKEEGTVSQSGVPFASDPEPGNDLEPPKQPPLTDEQAIQETAKQLFETHPAFQGTMDSTLRALRSVIRGENRGSIASLLEHVRRQHARWMECGQWKAGKINGLGRWLEDGRWKEDPPRDSSSPAPQKQEIKRIYPEFPK